MHIVFDIEANSLDTSIAKIHCIVAREIGKNQFYYFHDEPSKFMSKSPHFRIERFGDLLRRTSVIIGHNILKYDFEILERYFGKESIPKTFIDTLLWSKVLYPDRPLHRSCPTSVLGNDGKLRKITRHSLEAWGYRVHILKPEHNDWENFSDTMLERCYHDVRINSLVYLQLKKEVEDSHV